MLVADCAHLKELGDRGAHGFRAEPIGESGDDRVFRASVLDDRAKRGRRGFVEREHRRARHEVQEVASRRLKQMKLARRERDHRATSASSHLIYSGTVTSRCARALSGRGCGELVVVVATTQTSP